MVGTLRCTRNTEGVMGELRGVVGTLRCDRNTVRCGRNTVKCDRHKPLQPVKLNV